ncbi:MAG TPA: SGNH/GDSL hydrolase family protein [Candidatus Binatia bacterium]|nr:SGNH/GDSL hydrolase family protein [Candidatus Binatia bacterium]
MSWLQLALRQHEVCWHTPRHPGEQRVFLYGNSAIFGYPLPTEQTLSYLLNQHFDRSDGPAYVFNLGFAGSFQVKDALIMRASLAYQPDAIVYAATLSDFDHFAPCWLPGIVRLFDGNRSLALQFASERPAGLAEPLQIYRTVLTTPSPEHSRAQPLWQIGAFVRTLAREHADRVRHYLLPSLRDSAINTSGRQTHYDCAKTREEAGHLYNHWQEWNILAYLKEVSDSTGVPVAIVNWPVAHEPVDDCYNVRFTNAALSEYNLWLAEEAKAAGFAYLDLHDFLAPEDFVDSLHVSAPGHRKLAERFAPFLDALLSEIESTRQRTRQTATERTATAQTERSGDRPPERQHE